MANNDYALGTGLLPGEQFTRLADQVFTPGSNAIFQLQGLLPPQRKVTRVLFELDTDITQPGAGMAAQIGTVLPQLISRVQIGRRVNISGLALHNLAWMKLGKEVHVSAGFPATAGGVFSRSPKWTLPFLDFRSRKPDDFCVPTELFQDQISVSCGTNAIFAATAPTLGNAVLHCWVGHLPDPAKGGSRVLPPSLLMLSDPYQAVPAVINRPGRWKYGAIFREASNDAGGISSAQVTALIAMLDGAPNILGTSARAEDLVSLFNLGVASASVRAESQTVPVAGGMLNDHYGPAAAAGQSITAEFLPFLFPAQGYQIADLPWVHQGVTFSIAGTLTGHTVVEEIIEARNDAMVAKATAKLVPGGKASWKPKTHSGKPLYDASLVPFLPLRLTPVA